MQQKPPTREVAPYDQSADSEAALWNQAERYRGTEIDEVTRPAKPRRRARKKKRSTVGRVPALLSFVALVYSATWGIPVVLLSIYLSHRALRRGKLSGAWQLFARITRIAGVVALFGQVAWLVTRSQLG
jgi:hypothetical protein